MLGFILTLLIYRFVDRDMFMQFWGGGVGHKATRDWDEFLQSEGHEPNEVGDDSSDEENDEEEEDSEDEDIEADVNEEPEDSSSDEEDEEDIVIADNSEELDDDILAEEGYGAL
jgi:hypothetical protein